MGVPLASIMSREIGRKEAESSAEGGDKLVTPARSTLNAPNSSVGGNARGDMGMPSTSHTMYWESDIQRLCVGENKWVYVHSCYAPPSLTLPEFEEILDSVVHDLRGRSPKVIAGDFNAWVREWGSRETNARGAVSKTLLQSWI
ncbi:unnamed protein product [Hermetia illucens]|uniref:Endonuclease/exonuclease/phosphatase domain-containing protein n=1 Tax=Hermetia illucens TaxID=343691 RepID=A0A7R8V5X2_HERIL|nr:unnamed protein product [Hermetia illucens]